MRPMLLPAVMTMMASMLIGSNAMSQHLPWCSLYASGSLDCGFVSYEQCIVNVSSLGGRCIKHPHAAARPTPLDRDRTNPNYNQRTTKQFSTRKVSTKRASTERVTTQGTIDQRSTKVGSKALVPLGTGTQTRPGLKASLPLPDHTLLELPPDFDCELKTVSVDGAGGQPQPSLTSQTAPSADVALRMKLDYERQCYRHVGIILRDQLQKLQVAVGETIKAAASARASHGLSAQPGNTVSSR
jgi:hypothetical protein